MRVVLFALWFVGAIALGANPDEPAGPDGIEEAAETDTDAEIRRIEEGVSGADDVKEFVPTKPLSADKAIALPSDI